MSNKKGAAAGIASATAIKLTNGSSITWGALTGAADDVIYGINSGMPTPYKMEWTKEEWMNYLKDYEECQGLKDAMATMNSKLYKELK